MTMLWGRTGQKGFPRERLGRRPAVLGFYAWQYSGCPMKAGNLSESEGSDAFWVPLYSSIYLRESHVQGNRFDLENPGLDAARSIPAWAGEPVRPLVWIFARSVYPRVGGGTRDAYGVVNPTWGLSPRGRGNRGVHRSQIKGDRSIPAWAGEPHFASSVP